MASDDDSDLPFDAKRRLCPDGSCVGVLGADGRCGVCGQTAGRAPDAELAPRPSDAVVPDDDRHLEDEVEQDGDATAGFDANRRLCSDGSCVGVVGADNRCRVCGKPA